MAPSRARNRLRADLMSAAQADLPIPNILDIKKGDAEDEIVFTFTHPQLSPSPTAEIHVLPQDVAGYPDENFFLAYTTNDVPAAIAKTLEDSMGETAGMRIGDMLEALSSSLCASLDSIQNGEREDSVMTDVDADEDFPDAADESEEDVNFEYGDEDDFGQEHAAFAGPVKMTSTSTSTLSRIRQDLRIVKNAGFRVGKICGFDQANAHSIVSTSVRVSNLGLSEETREAWNLSSSDYIVLLIRYTGEYTTLEDALRRPAEQSRMKFRLRKCSKYRPTLAQALAALSSETKKKSSLFPIATSAPATEAADCDFSLLGIGESIDMFMDQDFIPMMKLRKQEKLSWDAAKKLHSTLVKSLSSRAWNSLEDPKMPAQSELNLNECDDEAKLPPILANDHSCSDGGISLPLIATQFALRHLVRCTDYCMICHEKIEGNFEALKPYVCGNPLCLFQYMSLGFGPSIDHEIITQPYVVDLLISFCYASLRSGPTIKMREFPTGLSLQVANIYPPEGPYVPDYEYTYIPAPPPLPPPPPGRKVAINGAVLIDPVDITLDWGSSVVTIKSAVDAHNPGFREGRWVVLCTRLIVDSASQNATSHVLHHARIEQKTGPLLQVRVASRHLMPLSFNASEETMGDYASTGPIAGHVVFCDQNLDDLSPQSKALSMTILLSTLPSVMEMRAYLTESQSRQLATWDRMTPGAMGLLRWVVASNRSYIVQVDECPSAGQDQNVGKFGRNRERIAGVDDWIQFRFAQGSPEKEALFQDALKQVTKPQRTLVAWHGSPLGNWHSIIRQGLDYKVTEHGRAFGNGVYFSRDFDYSLSYTNMQPWNRSNSTESLTWPRSALKATGAISLNELVNLPEQYQENRTHFVVQHCHWIQCRYLFVLPISDVSPNTAHQNSAAVQKRIPGEEFVQDSRWTTTGPGRGELYIPKIAIPSAQDGNKSTQSTSSQTNEDTPYGDSDEDIEDTLFLEEDTQSTPTVSAGMKHNLIGGLPPTPTHQEPQTDFRPGTLDLSALPQLAPPSYATEAAQKTIQRELKKMQQTQATTPLHELGWYMDFENINNMFQWIVELHSFDPDLPLAQDMKKAKITSIVLEIRFLRGFPISPPFVRVIRPRFLPFMNGGGGHVTTGGAMCMELLTNSGWSPANSLESVLLQVRMAICSSVPKPARLESCMYGQDGSDRMYGVVEAVEAYKRAAANHDWEVPKDLDEATQQMQPVASGAT
ncbi:Uu.00g072870.m01.CDS01 [Anthostomella pinea]|uniref:Uu.00g072870.m01.CDS01 n=1 Tax=Anthostomella pinea TaxID=933095 RepID=A0AAI8VV59_9PEZI|nr:Uu.00g072870.m01.CDS01 [Anthostomella pinea]